MRITFRCKICNKLVTAHPYHKSKYCSRKCYFKSKIKELKDRKGIIYVPKHIKKRDVLRIAKAKGIKPFCRVCSGKPLIHHIDGDRSNNKISNLDLLCKKCHCHTIIKQDISKRKKSKCLNCGKTFTYSKHEKHQGKFCSQSCHGSYRGNPIIILTCDYCGEEFEKWFSASKKWKQHFCSRKCYGKWKIGRDKYGR